MKPSSIVTVDVTLPAQTTQATDGQSWSVESIQLTETYRQHEVAAWQSKYQHIYYEKQRLSAILQHIYRHIYTEVSDMFGTGAGAQNHPVDNHPIPSCAYMQSLDNNVLQLDEVPVYEEDMIAPNNTTLPANGAAVAVERQPEIDVLDQLDDWEQRLLEALSMVRKQKV
jgi:hypothetical protein